MKESICLKAIVILMFMIYGIVGAIENGASNLLALATIPLFALMWHVAKEGGLLYESEHRD